MKDIVFEEYNEVSAEKYILYYTQDTMMIRQGAYEPHYFVRKDAVATKEKMKDEVEKLLSSIKIRINELLSTDPVSKEKIRQEIEKVFILREKHIQVFSPELDDMVKDLTPLRENLSVKRG